MAAQATAEAFETHKAEIFKLYLDEAWTLDEVMRYMADTYGFRATCVITINIPTYVPHTRQR
jgi:hypothetical protein